MTRLPLGAFHLGGGRQVMGRTGHLGDIKPKKTSTLKCWGYLGYIIDILRYHEILTTSDHQCERGMIIRRTVTGQKPAKALSPGVMLCLKLDESSTNGPTTGWSSRSQAIHFGVDSLTFLLTHLWIHFDQATVDKLVTKMGIPWDSFSLSVCHEGKYVRTGTMLDLGRTGSQRGEHPKKMFLRLPCGIYAMHTKKMRQPGNES